MIQHAKHFQFFELTHINTYILKTALESPSSNPSPKPVTTMIARSG
jgi:hypothetical protein